MKHAARLVMGLAILAACAEPTTTDGTPSFQRRPAASQSFGSGVNKDLATLRQVTSAFHNFSAARDAGWSAAITPCMTDPAGTGGMGFHYGNVKLIDGSVSVDEPELLLYEPEQNGNLRLVAVEYIVPYDFAPRNGPAPVLFGQKFLQNDVFQLWGLHAWVWKDNPAGMFANWNPNVDCSNTTSTLSMSH